MRTYTASEATERLGVKRATLYAYVSRGQVRSTDGPGRTSLYVADDVDGLVRQKHERRDPPSVAREALAWKGHPILQTSISGIEGGALHYRGQNAITLSRTESLESIAGLLWRRDLGERARPMAPDSLDCLTPMRGYPSALQRAQILLVCEEASDWGAYQFDRASTTERGDRVVGCLAASHTQVRLEQGVPIAQAIARGWGVGEVGAQLVGRALVLCADHELNASTFAARVAAGARASVYSAATAGLATLMGQRHGGITARIGAWIDEVTRAPSIERAMVARLRRGDALPGFDHPLYPQGDPRATELLGAIKETLGDRAGVASIEAVLQAAREVRGEDSMPSIDFALVALTRALERPDEDALYLFGVARSVGWVAHAIEQYEQGDLLRPRAEYVPLSK